MSDQNQKSILQAEASLESVSKLLLTLLQLVRSNLKTLLIWPLLMGIVAFIFAYFFMPQKFKAEAIIAAEEEAASGLEGLMAQFGLDAGGSNPGGVFQGESLVKLFTTRGLMERTLLQKVAYKGDSLVLASLFWPHTSHAKKAIFNGVAFSTNRDEHDALTDSALFLTYRYVQRKVFGVSKPDKKQSMIHVSAVHADPYLADALTNAAINTVTGFYIESLTRKARSNLRVLEQEADSVKRILDENLVYSAEMSDLNVNPARQSLRVEQNRAMIDLQVSVSLFGELAKNLKLAEISLRKQTPLIEIIDSPVFPLEKVGLKPWQWLLLGMLGGFLLAVYLVYVSRQNG
jgi:hypothetical protein